MKNKELQAIVQAAAKDIKTEEDLNEFRQMLTKITVEAALNAELDDHLGFACHEQAGTDNHPIHRFEPQLVKKHQRCFTSMDDKILFLYAQGMTT